VCKWVLNSKNKAVCFYFGMNKHFVKELYVCVENGNIEPLT
jgi:hypothetical protein